MQTDVLLVGQALHLVFAQLARDAFALGGQAAGALAQFGQLVVVSRQLFLGLGAGSFGFGAGGLVLGHGSLLGFDLSGQAAGGFLVLGHGGGQAVELQRSAQPFGRSVHALGLGTGKLGGEVIDLSLAGFQFLFSVCTFFIQLDKACAQLVQLLLAAEHTDAAGGRAAGERTTGVDDLTVQRDDAVAVAKVFGHGGSFGQILDHDDAAEQVVDDVLVARITLDQIGGDFGSAGQPPGEAGALHGVQRQEGGAACALVLQKADGGAGAALILDHDVLQCKAEGGLDGDLVAFFDGQDARHGADDAAQTAACGSAHDGLDALLVAVHVALQIFQNVDALGGGGPFAVRFLQVVGSLGLLAAAAVQFQL